MLLPLYNDNGSPAIKHMIGKKHTKRQHTKQLILYATIKSRKARITKK